MSGPIQALFDFLDSLFGRAGQPSQKSAGERVSAGAGALSPRLATTGAADSRAVLDAARRRLGADGLLQVLTYAPAGLVTGLAGKGAWNTRPGDVTVEVKRQGSAWGSSQGNRYRFTIGRDPSYPGGTIYVASEVSGYEAHTGPHAGDHAIGIGEELYYWDPGRDVPRAMHGRNMSLNLNLHSALAMNAFQLDTCDAIGIAPGSTPCIYGEAYELFRTCQTVRRPDTFWRSILQPLLSMSATIAARTVQGYATGGGLGAACGVLTAALSCSDPAVRRRTIASAVANLIAAGSAMGFDNFTMDTLNITTDFGRRVAGIFTDGAAIANRAARMIGEYDAQMGCVASSVYQIEFRLEAFKEKLRRSTDRRLVKVTVHT